MLRKMTAILLALCTCCICGFYVSSGENSAIVDNFDIESSGEIISNAKTYADYISEKKPLDSAAQIDIDADKLKTADGEFGVLADGVSINEEDSVTIEFPAAS
ncbi:MAG: hypothetical protein RR177_03160, partial [Oscillospiraceae bacterium]